MRLNALRLVNFRQHADTSVSFDQGLTGIIGPNGSGKTTILEAIAWALYGNAAARGNRDSIRFNRAGARASVKVELDFELGGHRYHVVRGLTSAELYLDGAAQPIANSITGVSDLLQRRLGMTRSEFFNTYFTGQKELNVMAAMGPSERAQFLSRVLGYERLRTAQTMVRDRRRLISAEIAGLRSGMTDPEAVGRAVEEAATRLELAAGALTSAEQHHSRTAGRVALLLPRWTAAQLERKQLEKFDAEQRLLDSEAIALARDTERVTRESADVAAAREELDRLRAELAPFADAYADLQRFDVLAREEGRRQTLLENEREKREEVARLTERQSRIATAPALEGDVTLELDGKRAELADTRAQLEARRTEWVRDRQEAETKRQSLRTQYAEAKAQRDQVAALGPDAPCPTCTRRMGENFQGVLDLLDEQIETVRVDGAYYKGRLDQLEAAPPEVRALDERRKALEAETLALEKKLQKIVAAVQELMRLVADLTVRQEQLAEVENDLAAVPAGYDRERHASLRREVDRLQPLDARAARLGATVERESLLQRERDRIAVDDERVRQRVATLRGQRAEIRLTEAEFDAMRSDYEQAYADARAAELAAVSARGEKSNATTARSSAERARAELARMQTTLDGLTRERTLHDELDRAYSDLRTDLNFALRPELSELASAFLTELTDARYSEIELDDQYNVLVLEDGIPKPVISGGEEDLANLVLRLAISQMIAERAGQSFSLLILDEVFGSLDDSRRHNVVELLRRLHDRFEQVILITHIEGVREGLDQVITVRYDEARGSSAVLQSARGDDGDGVPPGGPTGDGDVLDEQRTLDAAD